MAKQNNNLSSLVQNEMYPELSEYLHPLTHHQIVHLIKNTSFRPHVIFKALDPSMQAQVIPFLSRTHLRNIIRHLTIKEIEKIASFLDTDDVGKVVSLVDMEMRTELYEALASKRPQLNVILEAKKDSVGKFVDTNFIIVKPRFTVKDIAEKIQSHIDKGLPIPSVVLAKDNGDVSGYISHKDLILSHRNIPASDISQSLMTVSYTMSEKRLLQKLPRRKTELVGVLDAKKNLLGIIHTSDILKMTSTAADRRLLQFAGVGSDDIEEDSVMGKVKNRYQWLIINLGTAFLAAWVVSQFESTIARVAILAVYMPIVAGEGGNAATQALAVAVRSLALQEISFSEAKRIIFRESMAGLVNGLIIGVIAAIAAIVMHAPIMLALVLFIAMIVNMFIAGLFGALVPVILKAFKIDPAVASSIFVTTATDVVGFFVFLGLGSMLM